MGTSIILEEMKILAKKKTEGEVLFRAPNPQAGPKIENLVQQFVWLLGRPIILEEMKILAKILKEKLNDFPSPTNLPGEGKS